MKTVVTITPKGFEEVQQMDIEKFSGADVIEWRADFLSKDNILNVAPAIFEKFSGFEILFTLRTQKEGGMIALSSEEYVAILKEIQALYSPDYIDFEYFSYKNVFDEMLDFSNLVLSYHNYEETPENIMELFSELTTLGPRMVKIAVTPKSEQDVLDLMNLTRGFKTLNPEQDYVTISMGKLGQLTRLGGYLTGSSWTFTFMDDQIASGQISLIHYKKIMEMLDAD